MRLSICLYLGLFVLEIDCRLQLSVGIRRKETARPARARKIRDREGQGRHRPTYVKNEMEKETKYINSSAYSLLAR